MDAEAYVHIVMNAYHGDIVSVPGRLRVLQRAGDEGDGGGDGSRPLVTVRVELTAELPEPPSAEAWHLRFVGNAGSMDARSSDGTLGSFRWNGSGFTATVDAADALAALDVPPEVGAARVTHVLVIPEGRAG